MIAMALFVQCPEWQRSRLATSALTAGRHRGTGRTTPSDASLGIVATSSARVWSSRGHAGRIATLA
jgi:hypothetical protein